MKTAQYVLAILFGMIGIGALILPLLVEGSVSEIAQVKGVLWLILGRLWILTVDMNARRRGASK